ncbi:hypothetical protein C8_140 [Cannes 8 virus]|uniref:Uncharacterized protein n=1 Tax=Marseillevirus marseillevirus TaxID=694581 RepID=D2XAD9_GBMV|nr:hypothetical protein MAR_ORF135 [Marseillevirus marseillevirus]YP_009094622.1 hypothetical protein MEL_121 [Melbournevirus]AGV01489.1 hypothetical protein C8_140 [Cannes 8 virus]AVR52849.1 hypothetical protein MarSH_144 [Marseillevirus Shanghai 1]ADB03916.1 hypothetical protein MAR_ORF135 [Marseillevirus marseillevirus]AIT54734.1 hypothetical protein MEL_121 [Melbournevirus]
MHLSKKVVLRAVPYNGMWYFRVSAHLYGEGLAVCLCSLSSRIVVEGVVVPASVSFGQLSFAIETFRSSCEEKLYEKTADRLLELSRISELLGEYSFESFRKFRNRERKKASKNKVLVKEVKEGRDGTVFGWDDLPDSEDELSDSESVADIDEALRAPRVDDSGTDSD